MSEPKFTKGPWKVLNNLSYSDRKHHYQILTKDAGCYYHRTHEENERLKMLIKQRQDETNRLRLEEQRRNGTGDCAGCPFREMHEEIYAMLKKCLTDLACSTFYNRYEEMKELMRKLNNKEQQ